MQPIGAGSLCPCALASRWIWSRSKSVATVLARLYNPVVVSFGYRLTFGNGLVVGPFFTKEMLELSRRPRYFVVRPAYAGALLLGLFAVWGEPVDSVSAIARRAESAVACISTAQWLALYGLVPLLVFGSIPRDRQSGTLEILYLTPLFDRRYVWELLGSRLVVALLLLVSSLPFFALLTLLGGVSLVRILVVELSFAVDVLLIAAIGIYLSTTSATALRALVRTYVLVIIWAALPIAPPAFVYVIYAEIGSPLTALLVLLQLISLAFSMALIEGARARLVPEPADLPTSRSKSAKVNVPAVHRPFDVGTPGSMSRLSVAGLSILFLLVVWPASFNTPELVSPILAMLWIAMTVVAAMLASTSPLLKRRRCFLEVLLVTPLEPTAILRRMLLVHGPNLKWIGYLLIVVGLALLPAAMAGVPVPAAMITGILGMAVLLLLGTACSLVGATMLSALVPLLMVPTVTVVGMLLLGTWWSEAVVGPLTIGCPIFVVLAWGVSRWRLTPMTIGCLFLSIYLTLLLILGWLGFWFLPEPRMGCRPVTLVNPALWMVGPPFARLGTFHSWRVVNLWLSDKSFWLWQAGHWLALATLLLWAWWWMVRNFDRLVDRARPPGH